MSRDLRNAGQALLIAGSEVGRAALGADQRAQRADHRQNPGNIALVEDMDRDAGADQFGDDIGLQIGEGENEVGLEIQNLRNIGGDKGGDTWLLAPDLRRSHGITGNANDSVLLAEQIKGLDRFLGEADDAAGRELAHGNDMQNKRSLVTVRSS